MRDSCGDAMNCEQLRNAISQKCALTAVEAAHVDGCDACLEAWLDAAVVQALEVRPAVRIPADFAERVAARKLDGRGVGKGPRTKAYRQHLGLLTAGLLVASGLTTVAFADPTAMNTPMGSLFILLIAIEIAGIGLWLGIGRSGERQN